MEIIDARSALRFLESRFPDSGSCCSDVDDEVLWSWDFSQAWRPGSRRLPLDVPGLLRHAHLILAAKLWMNFYLSSCREGY